MSYSSTEEKYRTKIDSLRGKLVVKLIALQSYDGMSIKRRSEIESFTNGRLFAYSIVHSVTCKTYMICLLVPLFFLPLLSKYWD